nr:60S ribosomal protein L4-1-like [Coffea arabica]
MTLISKIKGKKKVRKHYSAPPMTVVSDVLKAVVHCGTTLSQAFNHVDHLNFLKLAPGGHVGRFIVWTKSAFEKLDEIYGSFDKPSLKKKGYVLPRAKMVNGDLARIINSDEVQSVVRPIKKVVKRAPMKKNPLKNLNCLLKFNPYAKTARRMALLAEK